MNEQIPYGAYGEEQEPYWRKNDSSRTAEAAEARVETPLITPATHSQAKDWDDSHWSNGLHYWLGRRYHSSNLWQTFKGLFARSSIPDEVVSDEVYAALAREPEVDTSAIEISVEDGHVTLAGRVQDHWMKSQVEEAIYFLPGVEGVTNRLVA